MSEKLTPGEVLKGFLLPRKIKQKDLAEALNLSNSQISKIVTNKKPITYSFAKKLGKYFKNGTKFWTDLQNKYGIDNYDQPISRGDLYENLVKPRLAEIKQWSVDKILRQDICKRLGIGTSTLKNYRNQYPELRGALLLPKIDIQKNESNAIHPGKILALNFIKPNKIMQIDLAKAIDIPVNQISKIVCGNKRITDVIAKKLAKYFKNEPEFWLDLQVKYDEQRKIEMPDVVKSVKTKVVSPNDKSVVEVQNGKIIKKDVIVSKSVLPTQEKIALKRIGEPSPANIKQLNLLGVTTPVDFDKHPDKKYQETIKNMSGKQNEKISNKILTVDDITTKDEEIKQKIDTLRTSPSLKMQVFGRSKRIDSQNNEYLKALKKLALGHTTITESSIAENVYDKNDNIKGKRKKTITEKIEHQPDRKAIKELIDIDPSLLADSLSKEDVEKKIDALDKEKQDRIDVALQQNIDLGKKLEVLRKQLVEEKKENRKLKIQLNSHANQINLHKNQIKDSKRLIDDLVQERNEIDDFADGLASEIFSEDE